MPDGRCPKEVWNTSLLNQQRSRPIGRPRKRWCTYFLSDRNRRFAYFPMEEEIRRKSSDGILNILLVIISIFILKCTIKRAIIKNSFSSSVWRVDEHFYAYITFSFCIDFFFSFSNSPKRLLEYALFPMLWHLLLDL